jgi:surface protein
MNSEAVIKSVNQRGDIQWSSMQYMFHGVGTDVNSDGLAILATDIPQFSGDNVSLYGMFMNTRGVRGNFSGWDTSNVTVMNSVFYRAQNFNEDLSSWDVSNVIDMSHMFYAANTFNTSLSGWDTHNVQDMSYMFHYANRFNQDVSSRNIEGISSSYNMQYMFNDTALSTYNYNAILDSRSQQNVLSGISAFNVNSTYGGECAGLSNATAGIDGHNFLVRHKERDISDNGILTCGEKGSQTSSLGTDFTYQENCSIYTVPYN